TSLTNVILESSTSIDLFKKLQGKYQYDTMFKSIIEKPKEFQNFEVKEGLVYLKVGGNSLFMHPQNTYRRQSLHEIIISEAHLLLAHLGASKTLNYLRDHVWWKDMVSNTKAYCKTC
ncbi:hypothetical protein BYT27DRAFT_7004599, partial [Phlegmacium glaucopus]